MKRTIVAAAVMAAISGSAFAQEVKIGGKLDAGYQFKRTQNLQTVYGASGAVTNSASTGGVTTETQGDGGASTSRITVGVKEDISKGISAFVDLDLRFTNVHEGKTGLNNNDKKVMGLISPIGKLTWGTYNITNLHLAEKPYMVSPRDMEIVKFGISGARESQLTARVTEWVSPTVSAGPVKMLIKGQHAFGDFQKDGTNNDDTTTGGTNPGNRNSGRTTAAGFETAVGDNIFTFNFDIINRQSQGVMPTIENGMVITHTHFTVRPIKDLKFSMNYNTFKGRNPNITDANGGSAFKEKNTNMVLSYNWDNTLEIGAEFSKLRDLGSNRNSGRGYMLGGAWFLGKNLYLYVATMRTDYARNESYAGGKYDGTKANFSDTLTKRDERYTRVGLVKDF
ncbi:porin [Viridibacterium curvum]|uniref:Porin domain-containing protein n=1 Tax=Viridibacterium curvum TaxID=1101404 RepID=A0ABP9R6Z5_9RHOO